MHKITIARYRCIIGAARSFARLPFHGFGADTAPGRQRTHRVLNFVSAGCLLVSHKPLDTESLEDLFTSVGSPLRSNKYDGAAEGDMSTAAGLEGAWSTRVASRGKGDSARLERGRDDRRHSSGEHRPAGRAVRLVLVAVAVVALAVVVPVVNDAVARRRHGHRPNRMQKILKPCTTAGQFVVGGVSYVSSDKPTCLF